MILLLYMCRFVRRSVKIQKYTNQCISHDTVKPHLSEPHLSGLFTYPDICFGTNYDIYIESVSGYSVTRTVNLGMEVSG